MPDFRVADTAPEHAKLRQAGLAAAGLWALAGAYAMRELTDGWVPDYWVQTWPAGRKHAAELVRVGLWTREARLGVQGYRFHDWDDYQRPAQKFNEDREKARERARRYRSRTQNVTRDVTSDVRGTYEKSSRTPSPSPSPSPLPRDGDLGGQRPVSDVREPRNEPPSQRPAERCPEHLDVADAPPCGRCAGARRAAERWDQQQAAAELDRRTAFRAAVDACGMCDEHGMRELPDGSAARCDHDPPAVAS